MDGFRDKNSNIIEVFGLSKKFRDFLAVDNVSFNVKRGEIFAFLGPNGAGKTTIIRMMTTLLAPSNGKILLDGINPRENQDAARKSFGIVFQDPSTDEELTAYENMEFHGVLYRIPTEIRKKRIEELLKIIELWDRKNDLVKTFSGGMRRRLEIARGLMHHPKILFLDEPTLGLDPQTRNHIWNYIKNLNKEEQITIFFTTHYMEEAENAATQIAIIDHGKIIAQASASKLMEKTHAETLEKAFLALTGTTIREETVSAIDHLRMRRKIHHRYRSH